MTVSTPNAEYTNNLPRWQRVADCVEGSDCVKKAGAKYLPIPSQDDTADGSRYKAYVERASYVNFTGHTKAGLVGMVFRKDLEAELPTTVEYVSDNANGSGLTLDQMVRDTIGETLEAGRYGLLVDYPEAPEGLTAQQVSDLGLRANIMPYKASRVINWRTTTIGGVTLLSLVVLQEDHEEVSESGFEVAVKKYHRVLKLEDGVYVQELWNDKDELEEITQPRMFNGERWNIIPFIFVGSQNNDPTVDKAPLLDIADLNISHYRNSADYEESSFMVGQPMYFFAGLSQTVIDMMNKQGFVIGSRRVGLGNEGSKPYLLQASPNQMPLEGMREKEGQMVKIGAKIITDSTGNATAEAAKIRFAGSNSQLSTLVGNVESAFIQCMEWALMFMGGEGQDVKLEINRNFYDATLDPQMVMAQIQLLDRGIIADTDLRWSLRRGNLISDQRTDEEIESEAEATDILR